MIIDETAAAYGLFQVAYAEVVDLISGTLFKLRQKQNTGLQSGAVFGKQFGWQLDQLEKELVGFNSHPSLADHLAAVSEACAEARRLATWRNDRAHARVRRSENGLALYHWRSRKRLSMTCEECVEKINDALRIGVKLRAHVQHLVGRLDWLKVLERALAEVEAPHKAK